MKTFIAAVVTSLTLAAVAAPSYASAAPGVRDPHVNVRQARQQVRIAEGVRSGELTRKEAHKVREDQRDIRQLERAYKSDGTLTAAERRDLNHELNQSSRQIRKEKHDAQSR
jgi:Skp family chaperone for outer membrane proteins